MNEQTNLFDITLTPKQSQRLFLTEVANDTLNLLDELDEKYAESTLYTNTDFHSSTNDGAGVVYVLEEDVLDVARRFASASLNPCVLNFANAFTPGGGWLHGAVAQEECIARRSSLIKSIGDSAMYARNKEQRNIFYLNDMIYSPYVRVLKDKDYKRMLTEFDVAVVTSPAVNMFNVSGVSSETIRNIMVRRIEKVLDVMSCHGHRTAILGAWGCGAFGQNPQDVAEYFYEALFQHGFAECFDNIVFAIYNDSYKADVFRDVFANECMVDDIVGEF